MLIHLKTVVHKAVLLSMVLSLLAFTIALAASGDLDGSFDGDGLVTSYLVPSNKDRWDVVQGIAIQSNGKIVAAGVSYLPDTTIDDFAVTRYNMNGSLDTTFSGDGRLITNFSGPYDEASEVAVQSDGKIIAAGQTCTIAGPICDVALARYNPGGGLDTTFSGDGKQITDFGEVYAGGDNGSNGGLAIQSDGKIVVAGYMWNGIDYDLAVYRYNANGNLDTTFSGDGMGHLNFGIGRQDYASDLVIQTDGKIVIAGYTGDANGINNNFAIARLNANGTADLTFSGDGRQTTNFNGDDFAYGLALQPNGKIVLVGRKITTATSFFVVARYDTNGSLDTTFNVTGRKAFSIIPAFRSFAKEVIVQSNGKIVVLGTTEGSYNTFALVRLNSSGAFDTTFSGDGKVTVDFGSGGSSGASGFALALQPSDGKYVLGGFSDNGMGGIDFALARVLP